ncbi:MAG: hypothetical protein K9L82_20280, partial [Chromatiaceae bacterium]|nr:hypothetical protein [Chromatiaceae bacterium]
LAKSLADLACCYPDRREAMAQAFATGVYSMQGVGGFFGVHYSSVSRAVRQFEAKSVSAPTV